MKIESMLLRNMKMEVDSKEKSLMEWEMEKASFIIDRAVIMMETGRKIICMDLGDCIILTIS